MATHVQDPAVIERRLRPIYDSLEVGNNKKALQDVEKFLKKNSSVSCARALKALALLRMGREDDAQYIVDSIADEHPSDDPTLQVMTFCYKEQNQLEKICALYTNAAKQNPNSEDILSHLFMAHVRVHDFQSQQTVALQLYKLKPKNPYYFWAAMSVVLKALRGPESKDPTKSKLLLALAQRMIDKQIADNKVDAEQEVQLYLSILQEQGKYLEVLTLLDSDLVKRFYPGAPISLRIDMLKYLKKWSQLNLLLKFLLLENHDRWDYYKEYLNTVVELSKLNQNKEKTKNELEEAEAAAEAEETKEGEENLTNNLAINENADDNYEKCYSFLCYLIEDEDHPTRGPYLARLQLHKTIQDDLTADPDANCLLGDFLELLVEYFRLFGDKPFCANDIILFLNCLPMARRATLATRLLQVCEISATTLPRSKEQMQKHICSLQVSRICGAHRLNAEHLAALYTAFSLHYEHGMSAFGMDLLPTDLGPSDAYGLLAVHVMYDLSQKLQSSEQLVEALCLIHYLLSNSPSNFHAKLLCLKIYHLLGCGWGAHKTYEGLDIKHVQLDSMGYLHCAQLPIMGITSMAKPLYDSTLKFFTASYKESLEFLAMCYKFGSFSKLQEFMDVRERLSNSLHYSMITTEAMLLEFYGMSGSYAHCITVFRNLNINSTEDRLPWSEFTDNRDLTIIIQWDPPASMIDDTCDGDGSGIGKYTNGNAISSTSSSSSAASSMPSSPDILLKTTTTTATADDDCIIENCDDKKQSQLNEKLESFRQDVELLRVRTLLLRCLSGCIETIAGNKDDEFIILPSTNEQDNKIQRIKLESLAKLNNEWNELFTKLKTLDLQPVSNKFLVNLLPSRLHGLLPMPYDKIFDELMRLVLTLEGGADLIIPSLINKSEKSKTINEMADQFEIRLNEVGEIVDDTIREHNKCEDLLWQRRNVQEAIANSIEILCFCTFVLFVCMEKYTQLTQKSNKKSKKKEMTSNAEIITDKDRLRIITQLVTAVKRNFQSCDESIDSWTTPYCSENIVDRIAAMSMNPKVELLVNATIRDSHIVSVKEFKTIIKEKLKLLK